MAADQPEKAADHLAGALAHAPALPEVHEVLGRLAARPGGGLDLFRAGPHASPGRLAARAHLLAAAGRPEDGLPLLAAASGQAPIGDWAGIPWVAEPALGVRIDPGLLAQVLMRLCTRVGEPAPPTLRPYLTVARHAVAAYPEHAMLLGAGSALARRVGEHELAVDWAARGSRVRPSKLGEIWLGYAYRSAGRLPEALAALRRAVAHDPDDLSVYADIAGTLADNGRLDDALSWVDRALERDPDYDCAVHTAHRLRHRADGDLMHLVRLADYIRDHPDESHEHTDLADCCRDTSWLSGIPASASLPRGHAPASDEPGDEAVRRLRQVAALSWAHPPAAYDAALPLIMVSPADLMALLAHPPADVAAAEIWACLGLLHQRPEEPWLDSERRRMLLGLVDGAADRVTEAALFALIVAAWIDPSARADVAEVVTARLTEVAQRPGARSFAELALATPALDVPTRQLAAAMTRVPALPRQRGRSRLLLRWRRG
ncbi:tetratricopeptide repeat protein [Actinoplanes bogorensis]|uniref:Tetratricopeptide repeat protein n=1 Tax=Paractinoplanes bogorensis TaxID=1610840 RepID=A0ABS5Z627_9ACTN|nr:tetratricopeptide repeat protein [Actinoplanes bogorensis]MBU2670836.1 tetratricopeptide repeat protein [Actinoplanes bogorensis]